MKATHLDALNPQADGVIETVGAALYGASSVVEVGRWRVSLAAVGQ